MLSKDWPISIRTAAMRSLPALLIAALLTSPTALAGVLQNDSKSSSTTAIASGEKYEGVPPPLVIENPSKYIQPWSGYCPDCTLKDKKVADSMTCQTANIKGGGIYRGIEVQGNKWMEMACDEARIAVEHGQDGFGSVIVQIDDETGEVIRYWRAYNHSNEWNDPIAHGETVALRNACHDLGVLRLSNISRDNPKLKMPQKGKTSHCEIYTSKEPCPMCYMAIRKTGVNTLIFASTRFDGAVQGLPYHDDDLYLEFCTPLRDRTQYGMHVYQSTVPNSLDAFNLYKRTER